MEKDLNKRQSLILEFINKHQFSKRGNIEKYISSIDDKVSKITVVRDLDTLLERGFIKKQGSARNTVYLSSNTNELLVNYDINNYFKTDSDIRDIKYPYFNFDVFNNLNNLFTEIEIKELEEVHKTYLDKIKKLPQAILKKEYERLLIELSWKSSQIEGNTYTLLDTETLIKNNIEAEGHNKEEALMILNHKKALAYIFDNNDYYKTLSLKKIEELHAILTGELDVNKGLRKSPVGIVGTNYKPISNQLQIKEAMDKLIETINSTANIIEKALIAVIMISYIQPFEDGNKRTGRILANAILYSHGYCPLSYRSVNETDYKKAVIIFYENNSLTAFKDLFVEQFKFAVDKYF